MVEEDKKSKKKSAPKAKKPEEKTAVSAKKADTAPLVPVGNKREVEVKAEAPKVEKAPEHKPEAAKAEAPKETHKVAPPKAPDAPKPAEMAPKAEKPKAKKKGSKKEAKKVFVVRGKRKVSVARATISAGKGVVRLNSLNIASINNHYIREIIAEPLRYVGPEANTVDISITVRGGGVMGQAQAARTAIANALAVYFDGMNLREKFLGIDKSLIIEDTRRVETKKFRGPKARARFQKSYR
jgi:small subunit ribosomal protein S9